MGGGGIKSRPVLWGRGRRHGGGGGNKVKASEAEATVRLCCLMSSDVG